MAKGEIIVVRRNKMTETLYCEHGGVAIEMAFRQGAYICPACGKFQIACSWKPKILLRGEWITYPFPFRTGEGALAMAKKLKSFVSLATDCCTCISDEKALYDIDADGKYIVLDEVK
jgi:hypothetical protein